MKNIYVIVPIYNGEQYIERCLNSIFEQTYKSIKIVCVNDGSKDKSLEILNRYGNKITILNQENQGVSVARNNGLDYVESLDEECLISFIDVDDYIDNDYFEKLNTMLEDNNCDISCCSFVYQTLDKSKPFKQIEKDQKLQNFVATLKLVEDKTIQSHSHCKLYKNIVWKNVRFPIGMAWMEDQATIFKTFLNAKNGVYVSNYHGYHYWQEGSSACRSSISNKRVLDSINGYLVPFQYNYACESSHEIKQAALNALANVYLMMIPRINKKQITREQNFELNKIKSFVKKNKIIKLYKPITKKEKNKKMFYLLLKPFYCFVYKMFIK